MTYAGIANLLNFKKPIWFYDFEQGTKRWFFVAAEKDYVTVPDFFDRTDYFTTDPEFFSRTWIAAPIRHGKIPFSIEPGKSSVTLTFPLTGATDPSTLFAQQFLELPGADVTTLRIFRAFRNDPDLEMVTKYRGQFVDVKPTDTKSDQTIKLVFDAEPVETGNKALVRVMQPGCSYGVYFDGCNLNLADFQTSATVTAVDGKSLLVSEGVLQPDGTYLGGILQWGAHKVMMGFHAGTDIRLVSAIPGLEAYVAANGSAEVLIARGCDKSLTTCFEKFGNHLNYPSFPWMVDSPIGTSIG